MPEPENIHNKHSSQAISMKRSNTRNAIYKTAIQGIRCETTRWLITLQNVNGRPSASSPYASGSPALG